MPPEEVEILRESLIREGCREPLYVWNGVLIDGHNRLRICVEEGIPFETRSLEFSSREEAKLWIIDNQLGRRNLSTLDRIELALRKKNVLEAQARERQKTSTGGTNPQLKENFPEAEGQTRDLIGEIAGVSGKTVDAAEKILESGTTITSHAPKLAAARVQA